MTTKTTADDYDAEELAEKHELVTAKEELLLKLRKAGITHAYARYYGRDGSSDVNQITLHRLPADTPINYCDPALDAYAVQNGALSEDVEWFVDQWIRTYHGDYEMGDGGEGSLELDVASGVAEFSHATFLWVRQTVYEETMKI